MFYKKSVFKNFSKFTRKHLCWSLFLNKVPGLKPSTLLRKRLRRRYFPVNFAKFLGTSLLQNTSGRLLMWRFMILPLVLLDLAVLYLFLSEDALRVKCVYFGKIKKGKPCHFFLIYIFFISFFGQASHNCLLMRYL